jgi:hypothetical protein
MLLKVMKGGVGGSLPPGHLRRGVIIPWVNLSVTGNGGTLPKVIPEGAPHLPNPTPPIMTELSILGEKLRHDKNHARLARSQRICAIRPT